MPLLSALDLIQIFLMMPRCKKKKTARLNNLAKARLTQAQSLDGPGSSATPDHAVSNGVNTSTDPLPTVHLHIYIWF